MMNDEDIQRIAQELGIKGKSTELFDTEQIAELVPWIGRQTSGSTNEPRGRNGGRTQREITTRAIRRMIKGGRLRAVKHPTSNRHLVSGKELCRFLVEDVGIRF